MPQIKLSTEKIKSRVKDKKVTDGTASIMMGKAKKAVSVPRAQSIMILGFFMGIPHFQYLKISIAYQGKACNRLHIRDKTFITLGREKGAHKKKERL